MITRWNSFLIILFSFLFITFCGDDNGTDANNDQQVAATVEMTGNLTFAPNVVTINAGETVRWNNTSQVVHTVTADSSLAQDPSNVVLPSGAQSFNSGNIQPGGSFDYTFDVAGTYRYFCIPHEGQGMVGQVNVNQ